MSDFDNAKRDAADLAKLVNEDVDVTTRYGTNPKISAPKAIRQIGENGSAAVSEILQDGDTAVGQILQKGDDAIRSYNITPAFDFANGFTIETRNQAGKDANGDYWIYNGTLPFTVAAGTVPSEPNYTNIIFSAITDSSIWGDRYVGTFASGFTYASDTDVARGQDGKYYRYVGNASYPVVVAAGTVASDFSGLYGETVPNILQVNTISGLQGLTGTEGQQVSVASYHGLGDLSGVGTFVWGVGRHNGGTFIDPNRAFPTDWNDQTQLATWFADSGVDVVGLKRVYDGAVNAKWFGAKGDSLTDDYESLRKWSFYKNLLITRGVYLTSETVYIDGESSLQSDGASIKGITDNMENVVVVGDTTEPITILPAASQNIASKTTNIDFTSAHSLQAGDYIAITNPSDFSYSSARAGYKAGEFAQVDSATSNTGVHLNASILSDDGYNAGDVNLYKVDFKRFKFSGKLDVYSALGVSRAISFNFLKDTDISGVSGYAIGGMIGLIIDRCVNVSGTGVTALQNGDVSVDYGLAVVSSQEINLSGNFRARRHGFTTAEAGADDLINIVNRRLDIDGVFSSSNLLHGLDTHGNTEHCRFSGFADGGVQPRGNHMKFDMEITADSDGRAVRFSELSGFDFDFSSCKIIGSVKNSAWGLITMGYASTVGDTVEAKGGVLNFSNVEIDAPETSLIMSINKKVAAGAEVSVDCSNFKILRSAASPVLTIASDPLIPKYETWNLHGVDGVGESLTVTHNCNKLRCVRSGKATISVDSAASGNYEQVNFGLNFGLETTPKVQLTMSNPSRINGKVPAISAGSIASSNARVYVLSIDNTPFGANSTVDVEWEASVN